MNLPHQSELRQDPVINRWVVVAPERAKRPIPPDPGEGFGPQSHDECPFCPGREDRTPKEIFAIRSAGTLPDHPGWRLRLVPNKFPALRNEGEVVAGGDTLFRSVSGVGGHEVIIETSDHDLLFSDYEPTAALDLLKTIQQRLLYYRQDKRVVCAQFFKNHGRLAGASLAHPHSQLVALPILSNIMSEQLAGAATRYQELGRCVYCQIVDRELADGDRLVMRNERMVAVTPYASRFAYETSIYPLTHSAKYEEVEEADLVGLAEIIQAVLQRMNLLLGNPPYNITLHSAPFTPGHDKEFHWRLDIAPALSRIAGFEWGSGFHINTIAPEEAARVLRRSL